MSLGQINIDTSGPVLRYRPATITAPHIVTGDHVDSILTQYFDGDPAKGGTVFDTQHVPHVTAGTPYVDRGSFHPQTCGVHEIYVRATPMDYSSPSVTAKTPFKVTDDPVKSIDSIILFVKSPKYPGRSRPEMLAALDLARRAFTNNRTHEGEAAMKLLLRFVEDGRFDLPSDVRKPIAGQIKDLLTCL